MIHGSIFLLLRDCYLRILCNKVLFHFVIKLKAAIECDWYFVLRFHDKKIRFKMGKMFVFNALNLVLFSHIVMIYNVVFEILTKHISF